MFSTLASNYFLFIYMKGIDLCILMLEVCFAKFSYCFNSFFTSSSEILHV